jgi:hypothetical protein
LVIIFVNKRGRNLVHVFPLLRFAYHSFMEHL